MYPIVLFTHFLGVIALFGGFIVFHRAIALVRRANTIEQAAGLFSLVAASRPMIQGGLGLLLLSGLALSGLSWRGPFPWLVAALTGAIVIGALVGGGAGAWMRRTKAMFIDGASGPIPSPLAEQLRMPRPWIAIATANCIALGVVWVMTTKPDWIVAFSILIVAGAVGAWIGARISKP